MTEQDRMDVYVKLLNKIYGCRDPKSEFYEQRDHDIKTAHLSYDEDEVTAEECDRAKAVLDKLFYADLLTHYCDAYANKSGTLVFEWYVDENNMLELEMNSKHDIGHEKEMTFILTLPETKHRDSRGKEHSSEIRTNVEFLEEVESKIRSFVNKFPSKQDEQISK